MELVWTVNPAVERSGRSRARRGRAGRAHRSCPSREIGAAMISHEIEWPTGHWRLALLDPL